MKLSSRWLGLLFSLVAAAALLEGCGELKVRAGRQITPTRIETTLTVGQSTARDVQQLLGDPLGVGRDWLPSHSHPRTVWAYYYEDAQVSLSGTGDYSRMFVWIFLVDDRYDGYIWVSNFPADRGVR